MSLAATFRDEILPAEPAGADARRGARTGPRCAPGANRPRPSLTTCAASTPARRPTPCTAIRPIGGHFFYNDDLTRPQLRAAPGAVRRVARPAARACWTTPGAAGAVRGRRADAREPAGLRARQRARADRRRIVPRVWLGNRVTVQTHYDFRTTSPASSPAAGDSRCFRPSSCANLYVGPLEFTLAGQPISMVRLDDPDLERYPAFREALDARAGRRARTRRRAVHPVHVVAPRRVAATRSTCW